MSRLFLSIAVLLASGLLAASASAMPLDANRVPAAATPRASIVALGTDVAAPDQQSPVARPAVVASAAVPDGTGGPGWTLSIVAGLVLVVAAAGTGAVAGRRHTARIVSPT